MFIYIAASGKYISLLCRLTLLCSPGVAVLCLSLLCPGRRWRQMPTDCCLAAFWPFSRRAWALPFAAGFFATGAVYTNFQPNEFGVVTALGLPSSCFGSFVAGILFA